MFTILCDGPIGCFDYYGLHIICIDEIKNSVVQSDLSGRKIERFSLPMSLNTDNYCWLKIFYVSGKFILGLLKSHSDRSFHLVTFRLNFDNMSCNLIKHINTGISSNGLRVEAHRSMSQFVFSICNKSKQINNSKILKRDSDRKSFMKQLEAQNSSPPNEDLTKHEVNEATSLKYSGEVNIATENMNILESVFLLVKTETNGDIIPTILSTGRRRYGIKLRRTRSLRDLRKTFSTKFMTRWKTISPLEKSCEPFLWGNNACVICKDDPSFFYVAHTILNAKSGIIAAILNKFSHRFRMHTPVTEPLTNQIRGIGPDSNHYWSNFDIIQGMPTILTMEPETRKLTRWQIRRDNFSNYEWKKMELEICAPLGTVQLLFRSNAEHVTSLEFTLRFQLKHSDGRAYFHNMSIPKIVFNADPSEL